MSMHNVYRGGRGYLVTINRIYVAVLESMWQYRVYVAVQGLYGSSGDYVALIGRLPCTSITAT